MVKFLPFVVCALSLITGETAFAAAPAAANFISPTAYENLYPVMNNKMRTTLNPGVTPELTQNAISTLIRTRDQSTTGRRVVSRSATSAARSASAPTTVARSGTSATGGASATTQTRRVVSRGNIAQNATVRSSGRADNSATSRAGALTSVTNSTTESVSSGRCLADYTQCMNGYCERKNTSYNRCYCSAKLAQVDAEYQPAIDKLIKQILALQGGKNWTDAEMNAYWDKIVGQHTGDNSWVNLDNALDINWADTESRVRGQQAFATGHEYCVQHLRGCYYMAANMRDAYRSDIARDCATYETSLQKIKNAAESIVENSK